MSRALFVIVSLICMAGSAHATDGFFVCQTVVSGSCTTWVSVVDGVLSLDQLGITPERMFEAMGFGFGVVIFSWLAGFVAGSIVKAFKNASGVTE